MKNKLLLPYRFKKIGWMILVPSVIIGIISTIIPIEFSWLQVKVFAFFGDEFFGKSSFFRIEKVNMFSTIVGVLLIVGALMVGFSKEKVEDEFVEEQRLTSLLWAVWVNYALLFFAFLFVYELAFLQVMVYNMFTVLVIFIVRFNYILYRNSKTVTDEE